MPTGLIETFADLGLGAEVGAQSTEIDGMTVPSQIGRLEVVTPEAMSSHPNGLCEGGAHSYELLKQESDDSNASGAYTPKTRRLAYYVLDAVPLTDDAAFCSGYSGPTSLQAYTFRSPDAAAEAFARGSEDNESTGSVEGGDLAVEYTAPDGFYCKYLSGSSYWLFWLSHGESADSLRDFASQASTEARQELCTGVFTGIADTIGAPPAP